MQNAISWIERNAIWFSDYSQAYGNPLIKKLLHTASLFPMALYTLPVTLIFSTITYAQVVEFFVALESDFSLIHTTNFIKKHHHWFISFIAHNENPLSRSLFCRFDNFSAEALSRLLPWMLQGISRSSAEVFFARLDNDGSMKKPMKWITDHADWFSTFTEREGNPLIQPLLRRLSGEALRTLPLSMLQGITVNQAANFLFSLDDSLEVDHALAWITHHADWFMDFAERKGNPLIEILLRRLSREALRTLPLLMLQGITLNQAKDFFVRLDGSVGVEHAMAWIRDNVDWFKEFAERQGNPVIDNLLRHLSEEALRTLPLPMLQGITLHQATYFLDKLADSFGVEQAMAWIRNNADWFKEFAQQRGNPVLAILLNRIPREELSHIPALMLEGATQAEVEFFFKQLYRHGPGLAQTLTYAEQNKIWLQYFINNGDPLVVLTHHVLRNIFWLRIPLLVDEQQHERLPDTLLRQWQTFDASNDLNWDAMNYYWDADKYS